MDANADSNVVNAVGSEATDMRGMLDSYRQQMQLPPARHVAVPEGLLKLAARLGDYLPASSLCTDTLAMLASNNTADASDFAKLLGHAPKGYREFIVPADLAV